MRGMPLILAGLAFAVAFALIAMSGVGGIVGMDGSAGQDQLDRTAEEYVDEDGETTTSFDESGDRSIAGHVVAGVRGVASVVGVVLWLPSVLRSVGLPGYAAEIFGRGVQILIGLFAVQVALRFDL